MIDTKSVETAFRILLQSPTQSKIHSHYYDLWKNLLRTVACMHLPCSLGPLRGYARTCVCSLFSVCVDRSIKTNAELCIFLGRNLIR